MIQQILVSNDINSVKLNLQASYFFYVIIYEEQMW